MKSFNVGKVSVDVRFHRSEVSLIWRGQSCERDPNAVLGPPLQDIATEITPHHTVIIDVRELTYMNSASVRPLLLFVQAVAKTAHEVRIMYSSDKNWQRLSFMAMQAVLATQKNVVFVS